MASKTTPAASTNTSGAKEVHPDDDNDEFVDLVVGGYSYRPTRAVLLSSPFHSGDGENYFRALLSGRWKRTKRSKPIDIPDMDGRLFFYVLLFLQVGQLPRNLDSAAYQSLLSREDIDGLELQADFFGLTRLVDLCKAAKDVLKGVRGTGDLDLTPFSDFSVVTKDDKAISERLADFRIIQRQLDFRMNYTYNGATKVEANVGLYENDYDTTREVSVKTTRDGITAEIVDEKTFPAVFKRLGTVIKEANAKKSSKDEKISVTQVLDQVPIALEASLWFAFLVQEMIDSCKGYEKYLALYGKDRIGEPFQDAKGFLFDGKSSFVFKMGSTK